MVMDLFHREAEMDILLACLAEADRVVRGRVELFPELGAFHTELNRAVGDRGHRYE